MVCLLLDHLVEEQVLTKWLPSSSLAAELDRVSEGVTGAAGELIHCIVYLGKKFDGAFCT